MRIIVLICGICIMDVLGKLFGSDSKVKIMRLFLFNPDALYAKEDVAERTKVSIPAARHELSILRRMKFIKSRGIAKRMLRQPGSRGGSIRKKGGSFALNPAFPYRAELERLLLDSSLLKGDEIVRKLGAAGRLKLVVIAGIFIQNPDSRVDVLVVGEHLKRGALENAIRNLEAEIGKELRYAAFETSEFNYRLGMYDKLVRDILDYPHKTILDRLGLPSLKPEQSRISPTVAEEYSM